MTARPWILLPFAALLAVPQLPAYSVLTHEAIIDGAWEKDITPVLLRRFPQTDAAALTQAHAYAYAGCIIQDMGYYPFGSKLFTDLAHYVRTGQFVQNLLREARDVNEYAFALGALAHYTADTRGHPIAVNASVPIEYPKLEARYGKAVTYEQNPKAHIRVEFSFDVLQVARGRYAPKSYHDFIGFQVAKGVLERAFHDTYSLDLTDLFSDLDRALGTYRHAVSGVIPTMTKVAWDMKKGDLKKTNPQMRRREYIYAISGASYRKEWPERYSRPGIGATVLALFIRIVPKVGPLAVLSFKAPTPQTEKLFEASFDRTLEEYRRCLREQGEGTLQLADLDLDTGAPVRRGDYWMADASYAQLAIRLAQRDAASVDPNVSASVLEFFRDTSLPNGVKERDPKQWQRTLAAIYTLRSRTGTKAAR